MEFEGMKPQREPGEDMGLIAEVAGTQLKGVPMQEDQAYYLHAYIDPMVDTLIANLDAEIARRKLSDEYQKRTIPNIRDL